MANPNPLHTKYKPEYCKLLIQHMKTGMSYESFGAEVGCGRSTIYQWEGVYPEWKAAKELALEAAQSYFEKRLVAKVSGSTTKNENFDVKLVDNSCLIFALKTRFHETFNERKEITLDVTEMPKIEIGLYGTKKEDD